MRRRWPGCKRRPARSRRRRRRRRPQRTPDPERSRSLNPHARKAPPMRFRRRPAGTAAKRSLLSPLEAGGRLGGDRVHARQRRDRHMVRPGISAQHRLMIALPHRERPQMPHADHARPERRQKISPARRGASLERSPGYGRSILSLTFHSDAAHCWNGGPVGGASAIYLRPPPSAMTLNEKRGKVDPRPCPISC
jgi:hypothetical protein